MMTNLICDNCTAAHNSINGRYCERLARYVEYFNQPICITPKNKKQ